MRILVAGGAGYVGSHMVGLLLAHRHHVTTLDNLSSGHRDAVLGGAFVHGDLGDREFLRRVFDGRGIEAVMHFASSIEVAESVRDPAKYYRNNVANTINLLDAMVAHGVRRLVFSSTAAIFGEPHYVPIDEDHPAQPVSPYGASKLVVERMLADYERAYGLRSVSLRYFNASGADPSGLVGERHEPETHLIPLVLQAASGRRESISIYGTDYATPDGTCIRDYVHVSDLCRAHLLALDALEHGAPRSCYNLGNCGGYSVREVIAAAEKVTGKKIKVIETARRPGDPERLVADSSRAQAELRWLPCYPELEAIIGHAWAWEKKFPWEACGPAAVTMRRTGTLS